MINQRLHSLFNRLRVSMSDTSFDIGGIASLERFMSVGKDRDKNTYFISQPAHVVFGSGKEVHTFVAYLLQRSESVDYVSSALKRLIWAIKNERDVLTLGDDFQANYTFIDSSVRGEDVFINNPQLQVCGYYFNSFRLTFWERSCEV